MTDDLNNGYLHNYTYSIADIYIYIHIFAHSCMYLGCIYICIGERDVLYHIEKDLYIHI